MIYVKVRDCLYDEKQAQKLVQVDAQVDTL